MKKLALFDLDGTLFDTNDVNYYAYKDALAAIGIENLDYEFFRQKCNGRPYTYFLPLLGVNKMEEMEKVHIIKKQRYSVHLDKARVNTHLFMMIRGMSNYSKVIVTTASRKNAQEILEFYHVADQFDDLFSQEDISKPKPDPEGFLLAMERYNMTAHNTIIFEDSEVGIEAAMVTGATVIKIMQF